jgi:hypothetical protein
MSILFLLLFQQPVRPAWLFQSRSGKTAGAATKTVHRLVGEAFLGPLQLGMDTNHKDGVKTNNRVTNLEYVTEGENIRLFWASWLAPDWGTPPDVVRRIQREWHRVGFARLAEELGMEALTIKYIAQGRRRRNVPLSEEGEATCLLEAARWWPNADRASERTCDAHH